MILQKIRVDAQAHEWVARQLAARAAETSGAPRAGDGAPFALQAAGDAVGGPGRPEASEAGAGTAADDRALGG